MLESPVYLPSGDVSVSNSIISFDGSSTFQDCSSSSLSCSNATTRDQIGIYTRKATIDNSTITGNGAGTGIEINSYSNYTDNISNSTIINNDIGVKITGNNGNFYFSKNNFISNNNYGIS